MKRISGTYLGYYITLVATCICLSLFILLIDSEMPLYEVLLIGLALGLLMATIASLRTLFFGKVNSSLKYSLDTGELIFNETTVLPDNISSIEIIHFFAWRYTYTYIDFEVRKGDNLIEQFRIMDKPLVLLADLFYDHPKSLVILFKYCPELKAKLKE